MIGESIKKNRKKAGLTQEELGNILGVSGVAIMRYEKGQREPNLEMLHKIADALEVSINELLGTSDTRKEFQDDFDLRLLNDEVMEYILNIKNGLKRLFPDGEINNTYVIQNIIIDRMADEEARRTLRLPNKKPLIEFVMNEKGDLITDTQLKDILVKHYTDLYIDEKIKSLEQDFPLIAAYKDNKNIKALNQLKDFYSDLPKHKIKEYILKVIYPEYLERKEKEAVDLEQLKKDLDIDNEPDIAGYYEDIKDKL